MDTASQLAQVPPIVWSGVVAAVIALLGVMLSSAIALIGVIISNASNSKRLNRPGFLGGSTP
jgi:hypothetical protein